MDDSNPNQEYPKPCALCGEPTTGYLPFCQDCKHRWQPDGNGGWAVPAYEPEKFNTRRKG